MRHLGDADRRFVRDFADLRLPMQEFKHADHLRLGWVMLAELPLLQAILEFRRLLQAFAQEHDAAGLYNETITCFYMLLIRERMDRLPAEHGWEDFRQANPDLFGYPKAFLQRYYPGERAFSAEAKLTFLLPTVWSSARSPYAR